MKNMNIRSCRFLSIFHEYNAFLSRKSISSYFFYSKFMYVSGSCHGSVSIVMGYRLDGQGSIPGGDKRFFSTPQHPDWLRTPPSLQSNGHKGLFPQG
jgi:hypothetical protein